MVRALDELEEMLQGGNLDGHAIAAWHEGYQAALASCADRGPEWPAIQARARQMAARLDRAAAALVTQQNEIRREMSLKARGARALRGYKPS